MKALVELDDALAKAENAWEAQNLLAAFFKSGELAKCAHQARLLMMTIDAIQKVEDKDE
jgi:hypothetical protein